MRIRNGAEETSRLTKLFLSQQRGWPKKLDFATDVNAPKIRRAGDRPATCAILGTPLPHFLAAANPPTPTPTSTSTSIHSYKALDLHGSINANHPGECPASTSKHPKINKMAEGGGIDRKADERMEFNTSKEVTVHPTFESMSLKGKAFPPSRLRPSRALYGADICTYREPSSRSLCLRL